MFRISPHMYSSALLMIFSALVVFRLSSPPRAKADICYPPPIQTDFCPWAGGRMDFECCEAGGADAWVKGFQCGAGFAVGQCIADGDLVGNMCADEYGGFWWCDD